MNNMRKVQNNGNNGNNGNFGNNGFNGNGNTDRRGTSPSGTLAEQIWALSFVKTELELYLEKSEYVKESLVYEEKCDDGRRIVAAVITDE